MMANEKDLLKICIHSDKKIDDIRNQCNQIDGMVICYRRKPTDLVAFAVYASPEHTASALKELKILGYHVKQANISTKDR